MKLSYLDLTTTDPDYNLAVEQYVFDCLPKDRTYVMLWQNDNAIIIGKHQNTLAEINDNYVRQNNIRVVRRLSGGGAVYHDLGNLNFTFVSDAGDEDSLNFQLYCQPIIQTLASLGVTAKLNGRNDITIDDKKFSGNAQYMRNGRVMHHGTIMFNSNLEILTNALKADPAKVQSKGIKSIRSRVTNVHDHLAADITLEQFRSILLNNIISKNDSSPYIFSEEELAAIREIQRTRYSQWDWNYGYSPACTIHKHRRFEGCGTVEIYLSVDNGHITNADFRGDFFSAEEPDTLARCLIGCRPEPEDYCAALANIDAGRYFNGLSTKELLDLFCE